VLPFLPILKEKLEVRHYIPRIDLLKELSSMDFLVNIAYDAVHQAPSKLIDYYLTGRPILSSVTNEFDYDTVRDFIAGNYTNAFVFNNIEQYKIENVATKFLSLSKE
jgi:hypothetical protein